MEEEEATVADGPWCLTIPSWRRICHSTADQKHAQHGLTAFTYVNCFAGFTETVTYRSLHADESDSPFFHSHLLAIQQRHNTSTSSRIVAYPSRVRVTSSAASVLASETRSSPASVALAGCSTPNARESLHPRNCAHTAKPTHISRNMSKSLNPHGCINDGLSSEIPSPSLRITIAQLNRQRVRNTGILTDVATVKQSLPSASLSLPIRRTTAPFSATVFAHINTSHSHTPGQSKSAPAQMLDPPPFSNR